jgi:hypothetical protein
MGGIRGGWRKTGSNWVIYTYPVTCCDEAAGFNRVNMEWMPKFDIPSSLLFYLAWPVHLSPVPQNSGVSGCKTTSVKMMNKHMKQHSQWLNIKTTRLASLTAIFCRKKQVPYKVGETPMSTMDVDNTVHLPEQDSQAGGLETIPRGPATPYDNDNDGNDDSDDDEDDEDETDSNRDHNGGGGGGNGGLLMELDSDEFKSDEVVTIECMVGAYLRPGCVVHYR